MGLPAIFFLLAASTGFDEAFRTGLLALQRNDLNAAATSLTAAAKLAPSNGRVWIALAQTYRKQGQTAKADAAAEKAAALSPRDGLLLTSLVLYYSESGQTAKAAEAQAKYAATVPQDAAALGKAEQLYFKAVQPLLQKQNFPEALAILTGATQRIKGSAQLELALGVAYYGMRRFDEAAAAFLRTIAIAPEIDQPYIFLGKFLGQVPTRMSEAMKVFVAYEKAHPDVDMGYLLHAKALNIQAAEPETARALLEKAISLNDRDPSSHFELGAVLDRLRRYAEAAKEFERAAEQDPSDPATHYRLARVYDRLGKTEEARVERERHAKLAEAQEAAKR